MTAPAPDHGPDQPRRETCDCCPGVEQTYAQLVEYCDQIGAERDNLEIVLTSRLSALREARAEHARLTARLAELEAENVELARKHDIQYRMNDALIADYAAYKESHPAEVKRLQDTINELTAAPSAPPVEPEPVGSDEVRRGRYLNPSTCDMTGDPHRWGTGRDRDECADCDAPRWVALNGRDPSCIKEWPECYSGGYDPHCCRFPKSCSCES